MLQRFLVFEKVRGTQFFKYFFVFITRVLRQLLIYFDDFFFCLNRS